MMEVKDLAFGYGGGAEVIRDIAFGVGPGECLAVLGNNGAGKSTMLKCLNRILAPRQGTVFVGGEDILRLPLGGVARQLAFVAQHTRDIRLTVYDVVMLGRKPYIRWGVREEDRLIVEAVLFQMGLAEMAVRYLDELSGGEQQKVMLARALAQQPRVLLLDEPTSSLDLRNQYEVLAAVTGVCRERGIAAVMVIHDLNLALRYCDRFLLLKDNRVYAHGGREVLTAEAIGEVYGIPVRLGEVEGVPVVVPFC